MAVEKIKVKAVKRFKDKRTGKVHKEGDIFEVTKTRYEEIVKNAEALKCGALVEVCKEEKAEKADKAEKAAK